MALALAAYRFKPVPVSKLVSRVVSRSSRKLRSVTLTASSAPRKELSVARTEEVTPARLLFTAIAAPSVPVLIKVEPLRVAVPAVSDSASSN
ncbi:hypothetical protein D3C77_726280 [compost metagenome]